ncbi:helicase POLQ-like [Achroia grisella]|uniref:helicase POLQ-like n=1 Tax=Achroia grisella TaxID=688607 RepID=UPI0027D33B48|nr:helicase POLQ-like [Achroia grisella]
MYKLTQENTSTPKRRRLGTGRVLRRYNMENTINDTPVHPQITSTLANTPGGCESPPLPCNQVEYLNESSRNNSSVLCSPGIQSPVPEDVHNWESLPVALLNDKVFDKHESVNEINLSGDLFTSKLDQNCTDNNHVDEIKCENNLREDIEKSFNIVNQSICDIDKINKDKSSLFETKDSFLLDIRESGVVLDDKLTKCVNEFPKLKPVQNYNDVTTFYGLPMITKKLFKTLRNIEKFYDWQEECLNMDAIKERRNLIYALPTSGGKTLVAEVLMLREVLNRKRNALFILPFVAIVQEKIWSLSPFAVQLDFLVEEYAGGKGHLPPKKRRQKNSIYIATIEKGLALVRSLLELNRLQEIGLIVVDELHLIGEEGRGSSLEILLSTVLFADLDIQIVGMSATIGNLPEIARFLDADVFERQFRPVELTEYVKLGDVLHRIVWKDGHGEDAFEIVPERTLAYDYSAAATRLDPDLLGGLVSEVVPQSSCLVFCPTKRNCENVAALLCKLQRKQMLRHRAAERLALSRALAAEGGDRALCAAVRAGIAYHHAGLAQDERALLEHAFRAGVVGVLCCTSTLAAGVNLPARRVVVRAPRLARRMLSLAAYRQMAGRAGRAGATDAGESIIICALSDWHELRAVLGGGLQAARSELTAAGAAALLLGGAALRLATSRPALLRLLRRTLLAHHSCNSSDDAELETLCDESLSALVQSGALEQKADRFTVSSLGDAAIKGGLSLEAAKQLLEDLNTASKSVVLMGSLHLLYLVTPHDFAGIKPDYRHYYTVYSGLDEEGVQTAKVLGITEVNAMRMITGKSITNVPERVLCRFYLALMLHDLWKQVPFHVVAEKYVIPRGTVQSVVSSATALSSSAARFSAALQPLWAWAALFAELCPRLQHCAAPQLQRLLQLPAVKKARALQLMRAGYKSIEDLAKASEDDLVSSISHLSRTAANHLISAARMMLIEKVENLRAEAEEVMEELKL